MRRFHITALLMLVMSVCMTFQAYANSLNVAKAPGAMVSPMEGLYLVGSFNDWQLPDANGDNGAVLLVQDEGDSEHYSCTVEIPAGNPEMKLYWKDSPVRYCQFIGTTTNRFELMQIMASNDPYYTDPKPGYGDRRYNTLIFDYSDVIDDVKPIELVNWGGGEMTFNVQIDRNSAYGYVESAAAPMFSRPNDTENVYAIVEIDGTTPFIMSSPINFETYYRSIFLLEGKKIKMHLSSEADVEAPLENRWGMLDEISIEEYLQNVDNELDSFIVGTAGKAFEYEFEDWGILEIRTMWGFHTSRAVLHEAQKPGGFAAEVNVDGQSHVGEVMKFSSENDYICEYKFYGKDIEFSSLLETDVNGEYNDKVYCYFPNSADSQPFKVDGETRTVDFLQTSHDVTPIRASFEEWGCLGLKFNYLAKTMEVTMTEEPRSGVGVVGADGSYEGEVSYYTLEGIKSDGRSPGIYLRKSNLGVRKVVVR